MKSDKLERLKGNLDAMRYILGEAIERNVNIGDDYSAVSVYVYAVEDAIDSLQLAAESLPVAKAAKRDCSTCSKAYSHQSSMRAGKCMEEEPCEDWDKWEPKP